MLHRKNTSRDLRPCTRRFLVGARLAGALLVGLSAVASADSSGAVRCKVGTCLDDSRVVHGDVTVLWPNGKKWKAGKLAHGKPDGKWRYFWPNGKEMAELSYKGGKRHGAAVYHYQNGNLQAKGRYEDDKPAEKFEYYAYQGGATQTFPVVLDEDQKRSLIDAAKKVRNAAGALETLAKQAAPKGLAGQAASEYAEHSDWLTSAADRVDTAGILGLLLAGKSVNGRGASSSTFRSGLGAQFAALPAVAPPLVSELSALNMEYLKLQSALKNESRQFQELQGPSAARHRAARKALAGMM